MDRYAIATVRMAIRCFTVLLFASGCCLMFAGNFFLGLMAMIISLIPLPETLRKQ